MNQQFKLAEISGQAEQLFNESREALKKSHVGEIRKLSDQIPQSFTDSGSPLSIVFAGQYSAGKSSLLKLLTGKNLKIGQGVTTAETQKIEWNGLTVIDTPGIHTQKHPDHDKITYKAISEADLIVFMLTHEGFGDYLGDHFRKLVYDMGKGHEMMLVVNKMDEETMGNNPETHAIKSINLNDVLSPDYTVDDMYTSFISIKSYYEGIATENVDDRDEFMAQSGWEQFLNNLNRFTADKRLAGRYTTNLYRLEQILNDALAQYSTTNPQADATVEIMNRNRRAIVQCRQNVSERVSALLNSESQKITEIGDSVAMSLTSNMKEDAFNRKLKDAYDKVDIISDAIGQSIEKIIGEETEKLANAVDEVMQSQLAQDLRSVIQNELKKRNLDPKIYNGAKKGAQYAQEIGGWLDKLAKAPGAKSGWSELSKLANYSNSNAHKAILEIGHFFGHKFKPWEAVKIAGKIGKAGKFLGVAGAFLGVAFQIYNDCQEDELEENLKETRSDIHDGFRNAANVVEMEYDKQTKTWIEKGLNKEIDNIDAAIAEIDRGRKVEDAEYEKLKSLLQRVKSLIRAIHQTA